MNNRKFLVCLMFILILINSGCVSSSQYTSMTNSLSTSNNKVTQLENELNETTRKLTDSTEKNQELQNELNDLKNGAQMSIINIRKEYNVENYDEVLDLSNKLNEKFPGTPEDIEAQSYVTEINNTRDEEARVAKEEEEKRIAEENKSAQDKARSILRISNSYPSKPNSASGVDLHIIWRNNSDKVIKYVDFAVEPYNAVNDVVRSEIGNKSLFEGRATGPFKKGEGNNGNKYWENAWYNYSIKTVQFYSVNIEYMDGTKVTLKGDDLKYIQY